MRVFDIDKLGAALLPITLRRPVLMVLVKTLLYPVGRLLNRCADYDDNVRYRMAHNSQVTKLQALLNDLLDGDLRRVVVADAEDVLEPVALYDREVCKPLIIDTGDYTLVSERGYNGVLSYDFVVRVPAAWRSNSAISARLTSLVNTYKLASKRYTIQYTNI